MVKSCLLHSFEVFRHIMIISDIFEFWRTRARDQNLTQFCFKILQTHFIFKRPLQPPNMVWKKKKLTFSPGWLMKKKMKKKKKKFEFSDFFRDFLRFFFCFSQNLSLENKKKLVFQSFETSGALLWGGLGAIQTTSTHFFQTILFLPLEANEKKCICGQDICYGFSLNSWKAP